MERMQYSIYNINNRMNNPTRSQCEKMTSLCLFPIYSMINNINQEQLSLSVSQFVSNAFKSINYLTQNKASCLQLIQIRGRQPFLCKGPVLVRNGVWIEGCCQRGLPTPDDDLPVTYDVQFAALQCVMFCYIPSL